MPYQIQITAPVTRAGIIQKKVEGATAPARDFYGFRNRKSALNVIQVPIGLPVYRMENFRTFTDQRDYLTMEKKSTDFFSKGQESEIAQQAQHGLLVRLAEKGVAESVAPVIEVIRKEGQREPLLVTASGVVVNGNRRLAGMRELHASEPVAFASLSHIDVMVLPADATEDEIVDIEANLQAMQETKLDYDWIGEAQLIKRLIGLGRSHEQVANQLHRKEKDIKYALQQLAEADLYLKEASSTGSYVEIREDAEQLFKDLPKAIEGKSERAKEASRAIAYALFRNKDKLPGRLYDFNAAFGKLADDVLERVSNDLGISSEPLTDGGVAEGDDIHIDLGDIDIDLGDGSSEPNYEGVIEALKAPDNEEAVETLIDAAQTAIELEKGKKSGSAAFKTVGQAHSKLASVDILKADAGTLPGIKKQLEAIKALVAAMEEVLINRQKP